LRSSLRKWTLLFDFRVLGSPWSCEGRHWSSELNASKQRDQFCLSASPCLFEHAFQVVSCSTDLYPQTLRDVCDTKPTGKRNGDLNFTIRQSEGSAKGIALEIQRYPALRDINQYCNRSSRKKNVARAAADWHNLQKIPSACGIGQRHYRRCSRRSCRDRYRAI